MPGVSATSFAKGLALHVALLIRDGWIGAGRWIIPTMPRVLVA